MIDDESGKDESGKDESGKDERPVMEAMVSRTTMLSLLTGYNGTSLTCRYVLWKSWSMTPKQAIILSSTVGFLFLFTCKGGQ